MQKPRAHVAGPEGISAGGCWVGHQESRLESSISVLGTYLAVTESVTCVCGGH